jgi:hypothetical protein
MRTSVRIADVPTEIQTEYFLNTSLERSRYANPFKVSHSQFKTNLVNSMNTTKYSGISKNYVQNVPFVMTL